MRIDFVVAPFSAMHYPSIGVSSLTALIKKRGHASTVHYESLHFATRVGMKLYHWLSDSHINYFLRLGDFLFALLRRPPDERHNLINAYLAEVITYYLRLYPTKHEEFADFIQGYLPIFETAAHEAAQRLVAQQPDVLGFTLCHQQAGASLFLAGLVKELAPQVQVWFGGPSCFNTMGLAYLKSFSVLDAVFTGEAEDSLAGALKCLEEGRAFHAIPGVITRQDLEAEEPDLGERLLGAPPRNLDSLPIPDFGDYFQALEAIGLTARLTPFLLLETSRGCWWGARKPCRFCGLDMHVHGFRAKSPERVLSEIKEVLIRYGVHNLYLVDSVLDRTFYETLFPKMEGLKPRPNLFGEIRSNLKRHEVKLLRLAGFECLQAGVEALDDGLLKLLNKGTLALHNIQLLKWCEEEEMVLVYNHLMGIPGETVENYEKVLANMRLLHHLQPPYPSMVYLDRFSEYNRHSEQYGIQVKGPMPVSHPYCFPEPGADVMGLCYHFRHGFLMPGAENHKWWRQVVEEIKRWHLDYESGKGLWGRRENGKVVIEDTRFQEEPMIFFLTSGQAFVLEMCDAFTTRTRVMEKGRQSGFQRSELEEAVGFLVDQHLVLQQGQRLLSLVVFPKRWPPDLSLRQRKFFLTGSNTGFSNQEEQYSPTTDWIMDMAPRIFFLNFPNISPSEYIKK